MITTKIVFDHRNRTAKGSEGPIEICVTVARRPYYINTGVRVVKERLKKSGVIVDVGDSCDADELNKRLFLIYKKVAAEVNACIDKDRAIDVADIRRRVYASLDGHNDDGCETVVEWIARQEKMLDVTAGTRAHYRTLRLRMGEFGGLKHWKDMTVENIYKWDAWLHELTKTVSENQQRAGVAGEHVGNSTVYNYHKWLRAMLNRAVKMGVIERSPYERLHGVFRRRDPEKTEYLTRDEMKSIECLKLKEGSQLAFARDIFIFQMYTGLAYSDTQEFDINDYQEVCGTWRCIGHRQKTNVMYVSMLLPPAVAVLERNGWHVPKMSNQKYNVLLKRIGREVGVARLHSHMGRHTFGTWMLDEGVRIEHVSAMMGHTNIKQTQRYAKVQAKSVYDDYGMVAEKMKDR